MTEWLKNHKTMRTIYYFFRFWSPFAKEPQGLGDRDIDIKTAWEVAKARVQIHKNIKNIS